MHKESYEPWLRTARPTLQASVRLICFPFAGGGVLPYRSWGSILGPSVDVLPIQLPGRDGRFGEPLCRRMDELVSRLAGALTPLLDVPTAFYGHSMGASIAYYLSRRLREQAGKLPMHLFVGARRAPHLPERLPFRHELSHDELLRELRRMGGTPEEVLNNAELRALFLPILLADFELIELTRYRTATPLECPITAFRGALDTEQSAEQIEAWCHHTSVGFEQVILPGGHFFLTSEAPLLLQELSKRLGELRHHTAHPPPSV